MIKRSFCYGEGMLDRSFCKLLPCTGKRSEGLKLRCTVSDDGVV